MYITITFSHDKGETEHIHKYQVIADDAPSASEAITQLLVEMYAKYGAGVTITTQQSDPRPRRDDAIVNTRHASRKSQ
jgi:hypothetical protein